MSTVCQAIQYGRRQIKYAFYCDSKQNPSSFKINEFYGFCLIVVTECQHPVTRYFSLFHIALDSVYHWGIMQENTNITQIVKIDDLRPINLVSRLCFSEKIMWPLQASLFPCTNPHGVQYRFDEIIYIKHLVLPYTL